MANENCFNKIIVLIDAENAQACKAEAVLKDASTYGRIVMKRAYANWTKPQVRPWENVVKKYAIGTVQQFDFASGKNASDMAMTIDAMEQLYIGKYDCFVIVSSDSDFTSLAMKLHESGTFVIGYGTKQTTESFRNACDEFNYVEDFESSSDSTRDATADERGDSPSRTDDERGRKGLTERELDALLATAAEKYGGDDGFTNVSSAGTYVKRVHPDFSMRKFGYDKLPTYLESKRNMYEVTRRRGKGDVTLVMYRVVGSGTPKPTPTAKTTDGLDASLIEAWELYRGKDGFVNVAAAGSYIGRTTPEISVKALGYENLPSYLASNATKYETRRRRGKGTATLLEYKVLRR